MISKRAAESRAGGWPPNQNAPAPAYAYWSPEQALNPSPPLAG